MDTPRTAKDGTDTPVTDNEDLMTIVSERDGSPIEVVHADFARTLERDLARLTEENEALKADAETGRQWRENSSLEKWFPFTAEELARVKAENEALRKDAERYRHLRDEESSDWIAVKLTNRLPEDWDEFIDKRRKETS